MRPREQASRAGRGEMQQMIAQRRGKNVASVGLVLQVAFTVVMMAIWLLTGSYAAMATVWLLTGGVARNAGVAHMLEERLGCAIVVPEQAQLAGAIGAALIARDSV